MREVIDHYDLIQRPSQPVEIFDCLIDFKSGSVVPVQFVTDAVPRLDMAYQILSVVGHPSCKSDNLKVITHHSEKFIGEGTDMNLAA
jgi:hypothetical protein